MATKQAAMQVYTEDQQHFIRKGQRHHTILKSQIDEALNHNPFNSNYVISSMPGLAKSYEATLALQNLKTPPLKFEGSASMSAFTIELATAVYLAQGQRLTVLLDDCDMLFESKNVNSAKKMFDDAKVLKYNKNFRALKGLCTELQFTAIESFSSEDKAGFAVPTDNITFIILTNRHMPTVNEVEQQTVGSNKESILTDLYSIRRRTEYKEIEMNQNELWGYVANITLNEKICEKFMPKISLAIKHQMLTWCYNNWDNVTERNLSLIEKLTKDYVRYPKDYLDIWHTNYIQGA